MALYLKCAGAALVGVVLVLTLGRKEMGMVLSAAVCAMIALAAAEYLEPVLDLLGRLEELGRLDGAMIAVLLKCVGIGLITEIAGMVCTDSGNGSLAKALQLLGTAAALWLAVPLFDGLLTLIQEILEGL